MAQWTEAQVVGKHYWTERLVSLQFEADIAPFKAGQFLRCGLDIDGERVGRAYSLINAPDEHPYEIYFNIVAGGQLSPPLAALEAGDSFWVYESANGFLVLDEVPDVPDLWLLSTGTAIGPFISMLKTAEIWQRFEHVVLVHAVRTVADLSYSEFIKMILQAHADKFRFVPFVSREQVPDTIHGRIPASILNQQLEETAGVTLNAERSHVMLCGNSGMIEETRNVLAERGMTRHRRSVPGHVSTEKYY